VKHVGSHPETNMIGNMPYTPRVKKVLALAGKEAQALHHTYVGTEHLLLGLLREGDGIAARVLRSLEVDPARTRNEILKELDPNFTPPESEAESHLRRLSVGSNPSPSAIEAQYLPAARPQSIPLFWVINNLSVHRDSRCRVVGLSLPIRKDCSKFLFEKHSPENS
jgi:hypothetical protein